MFRRLFAVFREAITKIQLKKLQRAKKFSIRHKTGKTTKVTSFKIQLYFKSFDSFTDLVSYAQTVCPLWFFKLYFRDGFPEDGEQTPKHIGTT